MEKYKGKIRFGIGDDVTLPEFQDQRVVVVGMGAFGVENVRRALRGGARQVMLLSRKFDKLLFPERISYVVHAMSCLGGSLPLLIPVLAFGIGIGIGIGIEVENHPYIGKFVCIAPCT